MQRGVGFLVCLCEKMFNMWENRDIFVWDIAMKFNSLPILTDGPFKIFYRFSPFHGVQPIIFNHIIGAALSSMFLI